MKPDEIKRLRESLLLTQEEFAQKLGVTRPTVSWWEKGLRHPSSLAVKAVLMLKEIEKKRVNKAQLVQKAFDKLNRAHFEGALTGYRIELSRRLKRSSGVAYPRKSSLEYPFIIWRKESGGILRICSSTRCSTAFSTRESILWVTL